MEDGPIFEWKPGSPVLDVDREAQFADENIARAEIAETTLNKIVTMNRLWQMKMTARCQM